MSSERIISETRDHAMTRAKLADGTATILYATYQARVCGCAVTGDGSLQHPLTVKPCASHLMRGEAYNAQIDAEIAAGRAVAADDVEDDDEGEDVNDPDEVKWSAVRESMEKQGFTFQIAHAGGGFAGVHLTRADSPRVAMIFENDPENPQTEGGYLVEVFADADAHGDGRILFSATLRLYPETSTVDEIGAAILAFWDADPAALLDNGHRRDCAKMGDLPDSDRDNACNCPKRKRTSVGPVPYSETVAIRDLAIELYEEYVGFYGDTHDSDLSKAECQMLRRAERLLGLEVVECPDEHDED